MPDYQPSQHILENEKQIEEIIGRPPSWITRWGISIVFIGILSLFLLSYFVKYPDTIDCNVHIQSQKPPVSILAQQQSNIQHLLVKDSQLVQKNDALCVFQNAADFSQILRLQAYITSNQQLIQEERLTLPPLLTKLGSVQHSYSQFVFAYQKYKSKLKENIAQLKANSLLKQITKLQELTNVLENKRELLEQQHAILQENILLAQRLIDEGLGNQLDKKQLISQKLNNEKELQDLKIQILSNQADIISMNQSKLDINQGFKEDILAQFISLSAAFQSLQSQVDAWYNSYALIAPIDGRVHFSSPWVSGSLTLQKQKIFDLSYNILQAKIALAKVNPAGFGKIKKGQKVIIQIKEYPVHEFGQIIGFVEMIPPYSQKEMYDVKISIPQELKTTYGKILTFREFLLGDAQIITEDRRLIERVLDKLKQVFD